MTTHKDTTMLELLARILAARTIDACVPDAGGIRETMIGEQWPEYIPDVRAILNELKHPTEGMVEAMHRDFMTGRHNLYSTSLASAFTTALDHVLNEGEG